MPQKSPLITSISRLTVSNEFLKSKEIPQAKGPLSKASSKHGQWSDYLKT